MPPAIAGGVESHQVEQRTDALAALGAGADPVGDERFGDDPGYRPLRVEGPERILENHLQVTADRLHGPGRQADEILALEDHLALLRRRGLDDRAGQRRLS